ncbi:MAG: SPASM domain-containing protein, partial [Candidatus Aenigmarchaeota archaeon]|nr:SPASM domain-containing protein [Candidatus Aenigmarchaeota archaeon]
KPPDAKGWDMDNDTAKAVVDFMFKTPARGLTIEFQGGDCSLNFNAVEYAINYARELAKKQNKSVNFSIVTNLTNVDDDFIKFLKNNIPIGLCTSLDGPKEVHDKNRKYFGGKGTYDDVTSSIKKIQEEMKGYDFRFHALTTITKHSLPYWKEIIDEYRKFGFKSIWLRYLNEIGFAKQSWKEIGYTAEEYVDFWKKSFEYILKLNKEKIPMSEGWARLISSVILNKKSSNNVDFRSPCGAGIGQLLYNHKGDIYTCDEAKVDDIFKLGNVKTSSYKEVLSSPTVTSIIDISSKFPTMCDASPWFPYSSICPVNVYKSHGNIIPDTVNDLRIKIQYEMIKKIFEKIIFNKEEGKILKKWAGTC